MVEQLEGPDNRKSTSDLEISNESMSDYIADQKQKTQQNRAALFVPKNPLQLAVEQEMRKQKMYQT